MGNRGRPSLKISPEERLERRRAQLAESQRKCRARKRENKKGGRKAAAVETPSPKPSSETRYREIEQWSMEIGSSEMGDSFESSPRDTDCDDNESVSGVSPASNPFPDNQAPEAHFTAHEIEQAVIVGGSMTEGSMAENELGSPETELPWLLFAEGEGMSITADADDIDWNQFMMGNTVRTDETQQSSPHDTDTLDSSISIWSPEDFYNMESPPELSSHLGEVPSMNPTDAILHKGLPEFDFDLFGPVSSESLESSFDWESYVNNLTSPEQSFNLDLFANNQKSEFTAADLAPSTMSTVIDL